MSIKKNNESFLYKDQVLLTENPVKIKKLNFLTSHLISQFSKKLKNGNQKLLDKDKINVEYINLFSYYHKKNTTELNARKHKNYINKLLNDNKNRFVNTEKTNIKDCHNLFNNKYIRDCNKQVPVNHIFITDYNNSFLVTKKNCFSFEKRKKVVDDSKVNNISKEKKILLKELNFQDKSNFNNKFRLLYKSPNLKKREQVKKYFSLIKKMKNLDLFGKKLINKRKSLYNDKGNIHAKSLFLSCYKDKNYQDFNRTKKISENKKKKLYIPILSKTYTDNNISTENMEKMDCCNFTDEIDFISSSRKNYDNSFFHL